MIEYQGPVERGTARHQRRARIETRWAPTVRSPAPAPAPPVIDQRIDLLDLLSIAAVIGRRGLKPA
ncbi:hypothetical protein [Roseateles sp.]|uniref:hypothetical protein n=1 Tax=Roseateles sp. TaxID=1971397 RepID=UPI0039C9CFD1